MNPEGRSLSGGSLSRHNLVPFHFASLPCGKQNSSLILHSVCFYILINYLPDHQRLLFTLLPASHFTFVTLHLQHFHLPTPPPHSHIPRTVSGLHRKLKKTFPLLSSLDYARSSSSLANEQGLGTVIIKLHVIWSNGMWVWKWGEEICWRLAALQAQQRCLDCLSSLWAMRESVDWWNLFSLLQTEGKGMWPSGEFEEWGKMEHERMRERDGGVSRV